MYRFDFLIDAKLEGGYFSFYKIISHQQRGIGQLIAPEFAGYILLNKQMEPVDTIKSNVKRTNLYYHDMRINAQGERLVDLRKDLFLDLRDFSDDLKDSAVHCEIDHIQIWDKNNKKLFSWNPLEHVNSDLFNYKQILKQRAFASSNSDLIEWTRLTSATWDYDGNMLYSMKNTGIGKISRAYGHIMWHIDYTDIPIISGKDTLKWYGQHDFNYLYDNDSTATYSLYSIGRKKDSELDTLIYSQGVIFEVNKTTNIPKLVKYINPQFKYAGNGQGNIDYYKNGDYVMGYGSYDTPNDLDSYYEPDFEYFDKTTNTHTLYEFPKNNRCYKAHRLDNWPRPPRPVIVKKGDRLVVVGDMTDWVWYQLDGPDKTDIVKVGTGTSIDPNRGGSFCVEGKYGMGYAVSKVYTFYKNSPY
jgi:hypothetical protein